jgi:hypothetical protein
VVGLAGHTGPLPDLPSPTSNSSGGTGTGTSSGKSSSALLAIELVE